MAAFSRSFRIFFCADTWQALRIVPAHGVDVAENPQDGIADVNKDLVRLAGPFMSPFPSPAELPYRPDGALLTGQDVEVGLGNVCPDAQRIHVDKDIKAAGPSRIEKIVMLDLATDRLALLQALLGAVTPHADFAGHDKGHPRLLPFSHVTGRWAFLSQTAGELPG
jgi:hypothetical protein